ncbi:MAG TPA: hypothetical protein PLV92_17970, partial [Pirellulaceae bacterium]|nr:hypothetical protein [Pirellulaceae bacterium]
KIQHAHDVVAAMKSEGIYCHFSIYFPLWLKPKPDNKWLVGYDGNKHPFAALFFNRDFQRQYVSWWKALLTTPDERTGKKLIDEPAVMGLELQNEDSYFFWTFSNDNIPDAQLRILESQYVEWLEARYGTLDTTMKRWNGVKATRDAPSERRLGFRPLWNMFSERTPRDQDAAAFLLESQRDFYRRAHEFVHKLGFKGVVTCSNWTTASPQYLGPLEKYTYTQGDFIDRHGYFGCNHKGQFSEWSIRDGHTYGDRSALRFDAEQPGKPRVFSHPAIDPSYDDKPSMISETTWNRPNRFRSEAPLYFAAYGALQDTDAIVHFALDGADWNVKPRYFMQPWTLLSPAQLGQFPAAALLFRQRMIEPGAVLADMTLDVERLKSLAGTPLPQDAALDELRLKDVPQGQELAAGQLLDPLLHYAGRVIVRFQNDEKSKEASVGNSAAVALKLADLKGLIDHSSHTVTSSHRQLKLDYGRGALVLDAPQVQGASGNVAGLGRVELPALTIESPLDLIHIIAVSLDGRPLTQSRKLLLQVMTEEQTTNFRTEPAGSGVKKIVSIGENPWLAREIRGTVRFTRPGAERLKVTPLDHAGYPTGDAKSPPLVARELTLQPTTMYYLVTSDE